MKRDKTRKDTLQLSWELTLLEVLKLRTLDIKAPGVVKEVKESLTMTIIFKCSLEAGAQNALLMVMKVEINGKPLIMAQREV